MSFARLAAAVFAASSIACATSPAPESGASPSAAHAAAPNRLTADEIQTSGVPTAFDAVDGLRPRWKRDPTVDAGTPVVVYVDQRKVGGLEFLRDVSADEIRELQYLNGREAEQRWGPDARGGAIIVLRK